MTRRQNIFFLWFTVMVYVFSNFSPILPFSFVRGASDYSCSFATAFILSFGEKISGCGESFTRLDKRGQKGILWIDDAYSAEAIYKPAPFFMSSRGYGVFVKIILDQLIDTPIMESTRKQRGTRQ